MIAVGATDTGRRRRENQDNYYINVLHGEGQALCVVCDGMGGANAGNVASDMALTIFAAEVKKRTKPGMGIAYMRALMNEAILRTNLLTYQKSIDSPECSGMGSTIVAAMVDGAEACVMNVGDSRAYLVTEGGIRQITLDHSMAEEMLRSGELTLEQARAHPARNYITRAVGTENTVRPDFFELALEPGSRILLCSDGLSNMVDDEEILFEASNGEISTCPERLIAIANERGGPDNITVVVLEV